MVVITMYNEAASELKATLAGIGENLTTMQEELAVNPENVAVVVVLDGRHKVRRRTRAARARTRRIPTPGGRGPPRRASQIKTSRRRTPPCSSSARASS